MTKIKINRFSGYEAVKHRTQHANWLRAAVLGANDGIVSTASLIVGVAAADATHSVVLLSGIAGIVAGAMSMAAGEYVSVSSQSDIENADIERERREHIANINYEKDELAEIYIKRGLNPKLAKKVAIELMKKDGIGAHKRDELGITETMSARPIQAAFASAAAFAIGAILPLSTCMFLPVNAIPIYVSAISLVFLGFLGAFAAFTGGANIPKGVVRVVFWGAMAMLLTAIVGKMIGTVV